MATLNGNLGGFKDKKMNCGAGKLISAEQLLLIHGDDCAFSRVLPFVLMHTQVQIFYIGNFSNI